MACGVRDRFAHGRREKQIAPGRASGQEREKARRKQTIGVAHGINVVIGNVVVPSRAGRKQMNGTITTRAYSKALK